jgi:hypothetical protein
MITRHWMRGMNMETSGGKAAYIASLMAGTTMLGAAALQINEVLMGRDPRNMNPAEKGGVRNWIQAMMKGGSLGIYGDFLFAQVSRFGTGALGTAAGPLAGTAGSIVDLWTKARSGEAKGGEALSKLERYLSTIDEVRVWDSNSEVRYLVIPEPPAGVDVRNTPEAKLRELVSRNAMVGVEIL